MADDVHVSGSSTDGNGFQLDLRQKKLGLTGPNVALLMLILIIGGVAYLRTGTIDTTLKSVQGQVAATEGRVHERVNALFARLDTLIEDIQQQNLLLTQNNARVTTGQHELRTHFDQATGAQNALLHTQTQAIEGLVQTQTKYIEDWFSEMGRRFEIHNFNSLNPDKALPLRAPPPGGR